MVLEQLAREGPGASTHQQSQGRATEGSNPVSRAEEGQPLSRSAGFQKAAAMDKERAGWELRRDESGRLDGYIPS